MPISLITGLSGQDGIHLARILRRRGHRVVGTTLSGSADAMGVYLGADIDVVRHDVVDAPGFVDLLDAFAPDEVYNLAGFTSVGASWDHPDLVRAVNATAVETMLESLLAYRDRTGRDVRFFQASSAEEQGEAPTSPYAEAKAIARRATVRAREQHGLFACAGILHNHESPLRPIQFVTRKITRATAEISLGRRDGLTLGNTSVVRDWGAAEDHMLAAHLMLQLDEPRDLTIGTGINHSLTDLLTTAFSAAGISDAESYVDHDPTLVRPADSPILRADISATRRLLGWEPKVPFDEVIGRMVRVDRRRLESGVEEAADYLATPS